jgi:LPS export ABC transporter protein LptC
MSLLPWRGAFIRLVPFLVAGILIAIAAFLLVGSDKDRGNRSSLPEIAPGEGVKLKEVRYRQDDPDRGLKWALDAAEVVFSEDDEKVLFKDFLLNLEPAERGAVRLTGKEGEYDRRRGIIFLKGVVEAESKDGYRIVTQDVTINEKAKRAESDSLVRAWGPFFTIEGKGLYADLETRTFKLKEDVLTTLLGKGSSR